MKELTRRNARRKARANAEKLIHDAVIKNLHKRWRSLYPRLEAFKNVQKITGLSWPDSSHEEIHEHGLKLAKAVGGGWDDPDDWSEWEDAFEAALNDAFSKAAEGYMAIESKYWGDKDYDVTFDTNEFMRNFQDRIGVRSPEHSITNISRSTLQLTQDKISSWMENPDTTWPELIDSLTELYGEARASMIAITETTAISSEVMRNTMQEVGVSKWDWIPLWENTCDDCTDKADGGPYNIGDEEPPLHPNCNCEMSFTESTMDE